MIVPAPLCAFCADDATVATVCQVLLCSMGVVATHQERSRTEGGIDATCQSGLAPAGATSRRGNSWLTLPPMCCRPRKVAIRNSCRHPCNPIPPLVRAVQLRSTCPRCCKYLTAATTPRSPAAACVCPLFRLRCRPNHCCEFPSGWHRRSRRAVPGAGHRHRILIPGFEGTAEHPKEHHSPGGWNYYVATASAVLQ